MNTDNNVTRIWGIGDNVIKVFDGLTLSEIEAVLSYIERQVKLYPVFFTTQVSPIFKENKGDQYPATSPYRYMEPFSSLPRVSKDSNGQIELEAMYSLKQVYQMIEDVIKDFSQTRPSTYTTLKLFVWEEVLTGHSDGIMFALAADVDEARRLIAKREDNSKYILEELSGEPAVYETQIGFALRGG